ncbi:MAG TPA: glycosyltransferase family 39 protein [Vicinamibacterales bacterium]|nr:glycosyltransferase family 39 protein [Vicinamibacterales bacterium]
MRILRISGLAALLFVVLFWQLGRASFWDPDEAIYAETSREVLRTGDWLAPSYNEQPFFDKPILFYWVQAAGMALAGQNELGARLAPALAGVALVATTAWVGTALVSFEVGFVAALLLAASPPVFALARYAILDMVFTAFLFGGASLLAVAALKDRPHLQWPAYVLLALAVLTKGPLALALCGLTFALALLASAELRRRLLRLRFVTGAVLVVALSVPWFVYMWLRFGDAFVQGYFLNENVSLFAANRFNTRFDPLFYFRVLGAGLLPWTGLAIGRFWDDARAQWRERSNDAVELLLWCWTAAIVGFFTLSRFKLDHYVFPAAPALCLLCARAWTDIRPRPEGARHAGARLGAMTVGPVLVIAGTGGGYFMIARLALPNAAILAPVVMLVAGIVVTARVNVGRSTLPSVPWVTLAAMAATYAAAIIWVLPALEQRKVVPDAAQWVAQHSAPGVRVGTYRLNRWSTAFRFYVDRHTSHMDGAEEARAFFADPTSAYAVMTSQYFDELTAQGLPLQVDYEREGMWVTSGRALWRRRETPTRFVVVSRKIGP